MAGTFIFVVVYISQGSGRELIGIADKNDIKVSYDNPAFLNEVLKRLQPVKSVKVASREHNGFRKAYIEITVEKDLHTYVRDDIISLE